MADDPVEAARRREAAMLRRSSYFPAANLRQFEGTELSPPGAGTYYNPERYRGAPYGAQRSASRALAGAYQSDLAFNVMHNPRQAAALDAERIGAQYGGGKSFAGKPGYQTVQLPGGGTTVVSDAVAKKLNQRYGASTGSAIPVDTARQIGYYGEPSAMMAKPISQQTPYERSYLMGYTGGREGAGTTMPSVKTGGEFSPISGFLSGIPFGLPSGQQLAQIGTLGFNALASLFRGGRPRLASDRTDLLRDTDNIFYGGGTVPQPTPTPTPTQNPQLMAANYQRPRLYFDEGYL